MTKKTSFEDIILIRALYREGKANYRSLGFVKGEHETKPETTLIAEIALKFSVCPMTVRRALAMSNEELEKRRNSNRPISKAIRYRQKEVSLVRPDADDRPSEERRRPDPRPPEEPGRDSRASRNSWLSLLKRHD